MSEPQPKKQKTAGADIPVTVRHQIAFPASFCVEDYVPIEKHVAPADPAKTYPFILDPFQRLSISAIERNESVLVSAHTSAGKTVVAEYAIALSLKNKQRVIYTSPIKALSNQKYREMLVTFDGDAGLMTGDVTINPTASCLVMTTEILRSMLYRGSEIMREVAWVIFDEIHYMRDKERGVVWEETIILLPHSVRFVFLSATIPNAFSFASWIAKTHDQPCHVVYTDYRPTPLQHYLFPAGAEGIHLVVDEAGVFREDNFTKAIASLGTSLAADELPAAGSKKGSQKKFTSGQKGPSDILKIVTMIMEKNYNPVIVFAFSKRECEALANQMGKLDFNTSEEEKKMVKMVFEGAISNLSEDDRDLPQISTILPLLVRGVGIHHGGLLPILKETIEILFQEGLIKVLFATETFSIGLNMPAKTVVFTSVRKFDGKDFRVVSGGEYIQMSGRAGRRGLDDRGIVIMMIDEKLEPADAKAMVKGQADRLDSAFHLGYNMILNLMRVEGVSPEFMLERCFFQYQSITSVPELEANLQNLQEAHDAMVIESESDIAKYYELVQQLKGMRLDFKDIITHPSHALPFLQPGRLVRVKGNDSLDFGWCVVISFTKRPLAKGQNEPYSISGVLDSPANRYTVEVLMPCTSDSSLLKNQIVSSASGSGLKPAAGDDQQSEAIIAPVLLSTLEFFSHVRLHMPKDLRAASERRSLLKNVQEVKRRFKDQGDLPLLDPIVNMEIKDEKFTALIKQIATLESRLVANPLHNTEKLNKLYPLYEEKMSLTAQIQASKDKISATQSIIQLDELKYRKRILRRLNFTTKNDVIEMKGRVACEISTGDELLLTEMIFNGVFNDLSPEQCASLLSCFVFGEKSEANVSLKAELQGPLQVMQESARRIAKVSKESKLEIDEEEYVKSFKVELMDVVMQWCKGAKFADLCKMTDVFEGSIIRAFRRLQELLRQMAQAAKAIGNVELEDKFNESLIKLDRPGSVMFNPSLYL